MDGFVIRVYNPKVWRSASGQCAIRAGFLDDSNEASANEVVAKHVLSAIGDISTEYQLIRVQGIPDGEELIPDDIGTKVASPLKSLRVLSAHSNYSIEEEYPRGCIDLICSSADMLRILLDGLDLVDYSREDLHQIFSS